jgi:hypothetical protein
MQPMRVHGIAVPLDTANSYDVRFSVTAATWDSCNALEGHKDCYSITTSSTPYWTVKLDSLNIGIFQGGAERGPLAIQNINIGATTVNIRASGANTFLNVVLDTAAQWHARPNPDTRYPSWGTIRILDITPKP